MGAFDDINLERTELWNTPPPRSGRLRAIIAGVIAIGLIGAGLAWWIRTRPSPSAAIERMASSVTPAPRPAPAAATPPRTELPPLDELDPMFSRLVGEVTASPLVSKWLATGNLARQVAALVEGAAGGTLPLRFLAPLRPTGEFSVVERHGHATIAPESYARYNAMAGVIAALDPATVVRVYQMLAPRLEEAHGELGQGERTFDAALRESLRRLSETPIPEGPDRRHRAWRRVRVCGPTPRSAVAGAETAAPERARQRPARADAAFGHCGGPGCAVRRLAIADALGARALLHPHFDAADNARDDVVEPRHEEPRSRRQAPRIAGAAESPRPRRTPRPAAPIPRRAPRRDRRPAETPPRRMRRR